MFGFGAGSGSPKEKKGSSKPSPVETNAQRREREREERAKKREERRERLDNLTQGGGVQNFAPSPRTGSPRTAGGTQGKVYGAKPTSREGGTNCFNSLIPGV